MRDTIKIGQISYPKLSGVADYLQLDICGLDKEQALNKYRSYNANIPVILHGDWEKKGNNANNLIKQERRAE
jgi:hypothetical protein